MKVLIKGDLVVAIVEEARLVPNGVYVGGNTVFADRDVTILDVPNLPSYVKPMEYKYTEVNGFFKNPDYVPYKSVDELLKEARVEIDNLRRTISFMNDDQLAFMEDVLSRLP